MLVAGLTAVLMGSGLALGGVSTASAEPAGHWGTFTLAGTSRAYTGEMTLQGFPATTFTSTSRQSTVVSGASTWQGPSTGPGQLYGSSRGLPYLNQRPTTDTPNPSGASVTTYTFAEPTPAGSWSFVLGDVDADQATIAATVPGGGAATADQLGFQSTYNSCSAVSPGGWTCTKDPDGTTGQDVPTWDAATRTLTGNAAAADTAGATAWFSPTVPLTSLTITYQQRSGFPVHQTWFADRTAAISGTATLDGTPIPGATVTATAPRGVAVTTTTAADGTYTFPELPVIGGYRVTVTPPPGADGADTVTGVSLATVPGGADRDGVDFGFASPPATVAVIGTVTDEAGAPAADVPVVIADPASGTTLVDTTTNSAGVYTGSGLPPATALTVTVADGAPTTITTGAVGAPPVEPAPIVAGEAVATLVGQVTLDGTPVPAAEVELLDSTGAVVATTTTAADGTYRFATVPGTYRVRTAAPAGATEPDDRAVTLPAAGARLDFPFTTPSAPVPVLVDQPGTVTDTDGARTADVPVTATPVDPTAGIPVTTTSDADGAFVLTGLAATTEYSVVAGTGEDAGPAVVVTTPASGTAPAIALVVPAAATPSPTPTPTPTTPVPTPSTPPGVGSGPGTGIAPGTGTTPRVGTTPVAGGLAFTGADPTPGIVAAGVLVLFGAGLLTFRAVRNRRRDHLQD